MTTIMYNTIPMGTHMAEIILGALNVCYNEGIAGVRPNPDEDPLTADQMRIAEENLVRNLFKKYPDMVRKYEDNPTVAKVING